MNQLTRFGALSVVLSLVVWADGGASAAPIPAAVSSKELKDLTTADVESTCQSLTARVKLSKEDACELAGVVWSAFGQTCASVKEKCMNEPEETRDSQAADTSCLPAAELRDGCTATVAEYEVCLLAHADRLRALTCDSALSSLETPVQACEVVMRKCPALATSPEDDEGGQGSDQP
ncbi:hypothetical protein [Sorangium sp. So ce131]|uniref:hypothetical protein n=1 Tax=Sorangium sp. So ce131 TaxID=3133282 RepID=UPI003F6062D2